MSDHEYTPKISGIMGKKVLGVPVIYFAVGFVLILAVYAWKTKTTPTATDASADTPPSETYPKPATGTVIVQSQTPPTPPPVDTTIKTNSEWVHKGVEFLVSKGTNVSIATSALVEYTSGRDITSQQSAYVQTVIKAIGLPPTLPKPGLVGAQVAMKQGTPPCQHLVKNAAENTAIELAQLYYGRTDPFAVTTIVDANGKRSSFAQGEHVFIPALPRPAPPLP